jgi:hypothetical protein
MQGSPAACSSSTGFLCSRPVVFSSTIYSLFTGSCLGLDGGRDRGAVQVRDDSDSPLPIALLYSCTVVVDTSGSRRIWGLPHLCSLRYLGILVTLYFALLQRLIRTVELSSPGFASRFLEEGGFPATKA